VHLKGNILSVDAVVLRRFQPKQTAISVRSRNGTPGSVQNKTSGCGQ